MRTVSILCVLTLLFLPGCFTTPVQVPSRHPVISKPEKPKLNMEGIIAGENSKVDQMIENTFKLKTWGESLEKSIDSYNDYADKKNKEADEALNK